MNQAALNFGHVSEKFARAGKPWHLQKQVGVIA